MADIGKLLGAVKLQLIIAIILSIIAVGLSYMMYAQMKSAADLLTAGASPLALGAMVLGIIGLLVYIWAGYVAAKAVKGGVVDGGIAGAIIAVIVGIISGILQIAIVVPVMTKALGALGTAMVAAVGVGLVIGIIVAAIIGFILGAIGGFIGRKK